MKKYKLIKEYPGSPELGTVCEEREERSSFCYFYKEEQYLGILKYHVENQPEYWEEINDDVRYIVSTRNYQTNNTLFEEWFVYSIWPNFTSDSNHLNFFNTKEEAEYFIVKNKPCLSLQDVSLVLGALDKRGDIFSYLKTIVKSKL
jgi:hypothetical protein